MSTGTDAPALATLLWQQFLELPRWEQFSFLMKGLNHYADGMSLPDREEQQGGRLTVQLRR
jgi:hypothetical protein